MKFTRRVQALSATMQRRWSHVQFAVGASVAFLARPTYEVATNCYGEVSVGLVYGVMHNRTETNYFLVSA